MKSTIHAACLLTAIGGLASLSLADDALGGIAQAQNQPRWVAGEIIVKFIDQPTFDAMRAIETELGTPISWQSLRHAPHARNNPGEPHPLSFFRIAEVDPSIDVEALAAIISELDGVVWSATNNIPEPTLIPNDPRYNQQWAPDRIHAPDGWDITLGSHDVIVASIDTGTVLNHEDLIDANWINAGEIPGNGIDDDNNGFIDDVNGWDFVRNNNQVNDVYGHGTQVAGIMSAGVNNAIGVAGMASTTVMHVKWWHTSGSDRTVAESATYAVDNGARVLNMSLSGGGDLPLTRVAMDYAEANNVLSVAAAGNHGTQALHYPAAYENVMAISGINISNLKPGFSGWGSHIDVAGPTEGITSTGPNGPTHYVNNFSGTSAASPHVAGVAGMVLSVNPALTAVEVRAIINDTAEDVGDPGFDLFFGNGRVHHGAAAAAAISACPADIDGDGDADADDFFDYLDAFANDNPDICDINRGGNCDVDDFFAYLDLFAQGC